MTMAQVAMELREILHREIPLTDLFKYATINALTDYLKQTPGDDSPQPGGADRGRSRRATLLQRPVRPAPSTMVSFITRTVEPAAPNREKVPRWCFDS